MDIKRWLFVVAFLPMFLNGSEVTASQYPDSLVNSLIRIAPLLGGEMQKKIATLEITKEIEEAAAAAARIAIEEAGKTVASEVKEVVEMTSKLAGVSPIVKIGSLGALVIGVYVMSKLAYNQGFSEGFQASEEDRAHAAA